MYLSITKIFSDKCTPVTFDDFVSECLHYNVHVCRGRTVVCIKSWMDSGIVSVGQHFGPDGYLIMLSEQDFQMLRQIFCCMKEFYLILEAIKEN